jgi:hypothetical protein
LALNIDCVISFPQLLQKKMWVMTRASARWPRAQCVLSRFSGFDLLPGSGTLRTEKGATMAAKKLKRLKNKPLGQE